MPKLWDATIESHRAAVRDATLTTTASLVAKHGVSGVTMSQIAKEAGIGRATLYKYFPDVETILTAWHEQQVEEHVAHLLAVRDATPGAAIDRLSAVLLAYARMSHGHGASEVASLLHRGDHVARAEVRIRDFLAEVLDAAVREGSVRSDVPSEESALYCLRALDASTMTRTPGAPERLVDLILRGLEPTP
jgi:AcrR family transcriptional regulator